MKAFSFFGLLLASTGVSAGMNLKPFMASTCENLGPIMGVRCVELQRRLESENVVMDANGAGICALIWQLASQGDNLQLAGDLVLSCFRQVSNMSISDEVMNTCSVTLYNSLESPLRSVSTEARVKRVMECIEQIGVPVGRSKSRS